MSGRQKKKTEHGLALCACVSDVFLALLLSLFILVCAPYESITGVKYALFLVLCGGYAAVMLLLVGELLLLRELSFEELRGRVRERRRVLALLALYVLFSLLSAALSPYEYDIWVGMTRQEGLLAQLLYPLTAGLLALFGRVRKFHLWVFGGTLILFCGLCFLQLGGLDPFGLYPEGYNYFDAYRAYSGEYLGTIGNADLVSALLALGFGVFLAAFLTGKGRSRLWALLPGAAALAALVGIRVAAGLVAAAGTALVLVPLTVKGNVRKRALLAEGGLCVAALVLLFLYDFGGSGTLYEFHQLLHGHIAPSFGSGRIHIWVEVLEAMPEHLLLGTGPDTMSAWELEGFSRYLPEFGYTIVQGIDAAHNEYLNVAAQQGLPAGLCYLALVLWGLGRLLRGGLGRERLCLSAGVLGYAIQAFFGISMCMVAPIFWAFLGLTADPGGGEK